LINHLDKFPCVFGEHLISMTPPKPYSLRGGAILSLWVGVVSDLIPNSRCNQQSYMSSLRAWGIGVRSLSLLRNRCKNPPHPTPCDLFTVSRVTFSTCLPMDDHHFGYKQKNLLTKNTTHEVITNTTSSLQTHNTTYSLADDGKW